MISIGNLVMLLFVFFLCSTGVFLIVANIGVSNSNLDEKSIQDLENLNIYSQNNPNPFSVNNSLNYSLTAYSNTDDFAQSNIETKGALESILDIFGDNSLSSFSTPLKFVENMSPLPDETFNWAYAMLLSFIGMVVFIAFLAAWKAGVFF